MGNDKFYVYIFLNQKYTGEWKYNDLVFYNKPFYVGIGTGYRMTAHFTPTNLAKKDIKNNIINKICNDFNELPIFYKIYENLDKETAKSVEISIIKHFGKIKNKTGILANLTDGGDGITGFEHKEKYKNSLRKKVYQYDLLGNYLREWDSLKSVINEFKLSGGGGLRASINTGIHCKGFLWSYHKKKKLKKHKPRIRTKFKYKIYKDNNLIKTFHNRKEIISFFNKEINFGNISSCCSGKLKSYLGYIWEKHEIKKVN